MSSDRRLNRSQRLGLDVDRHVAISAGAGTGKTTVMSLRYIEHLLSITQRATLLLPLAPRRPIHGPGSLRTPKREQQDLQRWSGLLPTECVAITFTNDAADELRQRIRHGCREDLLQLVSLRNVGRARARTMAGKGMRTVADVVEMTERDRARLADERGWSPKLVENIVEQARRLSGRRR